MGPGTGNLTKHLLAAGAHVTAVEKDDTLYARLCEEYAGEGALRLVHDDVLHLDAARLIADMLAQGGVEEGEQAQLSGKLGLDGCMATTAAPR